MILTASTTSAMSLTATTPSPTTSVRGTEATRTELPAQKRTPACEEESPSRRGRAEGGSRTGVRTEKPEVPIPNPPSYRDEWNQRW